MTNNLFYNYEKAKNTLLTFAADDECQSFFEKNNFPLELAYCKLLTGKLTEAEKLFTGIQERETRARWGKIISKILLEKQTPYPTYFDIKNFLEIDLNLLINYEKGEFVEEIIKYADMFSSVNPETHKYIGRVFWNNELYSYGKFFLERAKNYFYQDPELHVLLANVYIAEDNREKALKAIDNCLKILPEYFPAKDLKRKLIEK